MHLVLFQPEIPPNTGNVARLCAAMRVELHLIEPLGFSLEDRYLKRAGLDYWPHVRLHVWPDLEAYRRGPGKDARLVASSSRTGLPVHRFPFTRRDALLLGPETRGLPPDLIESLPQRVRIPISGRVRSLNLSTAAGILLVQALAHTGLLDEAEQSLPATDAHAGPDMPERGGLRRGEASCEAAPSPTSAAFAEQSPPNPAVPPDPAP